MPPVPPISPAATSARRLSLRSTEELLRRVLAEAADAPARLPELVVAYAEPLIAFAADRTILSANPAAEAFFGYGRHQLDGCLTDVLVPERFRQPDAPPMKAFDTLTTVELPGLRRDGTEPALSWTFGTTLSTPEPIFVMVVRDRAEIDDALEGLYASEQRYMLLVRAFESERAALEASESGRDRLARLHRVAQALSQATTPDDVGAIILKECQTEADAAGGAIYVVDGADLLLLGEYGHPVGFMAQYERISLDRRAPVADALRALTPAFFPDADAFVAAYPELAAAIREGGFEASVVTPLVARGRALGVLAIRYRRPHSFVDEERSFLITIGELCAQALERARLLEAQMAARAEAEQANRAKDEFLAMLGHELRNPLAPIATAIELMKLRGETHSKRERDVIARQLGHITRLVDDLLDVSRITRGKLELVLRPIDIADVIARAVEMASPLLEQRHHELSMNLTRGLRVMGDTGRLAQVISNLLSNAAKYTPPHGRIAVHAGGTDDEVVVRVTDNGEGIPAELLPRVFDLFIQGRRTFDRSEGGLGIGLSLVKNLVQLHGGRVSAASAGTPGQGSELTVRLPRFVAPPAVEAEPDAVAHSAVPRRQRVLVVDDNPDFLEMLAESLGMLGYEVATASDAVSALETLRHFPAAAAVLDLGLPVLDGFELARKIREELPDRTPRLIAVTGYGQEHDRRRSAEAGFAAHLVKPIDLDAMVAALER